MVSREIDIKRPRDDGNSDKEPVGRKGVCAVVHEGKLHLFGGYPFPYEQEVEVYDFRTCRWDVTKMGNLGAPRAGSCSVCIGHSIFQFGGWYDGFRHADIQELDMTTRTWKKIKVANPEDGPLRKDKAGIVDYGKEMLCVFGGYGCLNFYNGYEDKAPAFQKGADYHLDADHGSNYYWTNELHVFHIPSGKWLSPELSGCRPPPCAAFSFTRVDRHRVVLFGGRQLKERVNQLYILDMLSWNWTGPAVPNGCWPSKRSVHVACSLVDPAAVQSQASNLHSGCVSYKWLPHNVPDLLQEGGQESCGEGVEPKVLVAWGMGNKEDAIEDVWILHVNTLTWEEVSVPDSGGPPRIWGCAGVYHPVPHEAIVVAAGGTKDSDSVEYANRPSLLHFGLQTSLYRLCLLYLAEHVLDTISFAGLLPSAMQKELEETVQELNNKHKHFLYSYNL